MAINGFQCPDLSQYSPLLAVRLVLLCSVIGTSHTRAFA